MSHAVWPFVGGNRVLSAQ